jgi:thioredoxin 1
MATSTKPRALTNKTFDAAIAEHRVVLVDFWATWCGPCKSMAPDLEQIARESEDDVLIAKVDVDKERQLVERFNIKSMPTIITFSEGELHSTYVGAVPAAGLRAALNDAQKPKRKGMLRSLFGG